MKAYRDHPPIELEVSYRFLIESLEDYGVIMMDLGGRIVHWNEGAKRIFKYAAGEVVGKSISIIFSASDRRIKIPALEIATARAKGRADDERQHRRKDGSLFWASGVVWAIKDDAGKLHGFAKLLRDISQQKVMEDTIRHQSLHDILTGLPNRRGFEDRLTLALAKARANRTMLAVMFLDVDDFKKINDTLGHDSGDLVLQEIAARMSSALRKGDIICRLGGDEFIVLIDHIRRSGSATTVVRKLQAALKPRFDVGNKKVAVSASMGISFFPLHGRTSAQLEKRADIALYRAKAAGKRCHRVYQGKGPGHGRQRQDEVGQRRLGVTKRRRS